MKRGGIIALVLLLLGGIGAYVWYNRLKNNAAAERGITGDAKEDALKPKLELSRFNINDIGEETIKMNMHLLIDNPLPVSFKAHQVDYTVYVANTPVIKDTYKKPIEVKSGGKTTVTMPATLMYKTLGKVLKTLDRKNIDSTTYKVRASFALDVPIVGEKTFNTTFDKRMPTLYIPEIKVEDIDLGKLGLKRTDVAAKVSILNKNGFPINLTDTRYTVTIDGKEIAEGHQPQPILIKKHATTPVVFPVTIKPGKTLSLLPKFLFDKKGTPYTVTFHSKLVEKGENAMFDNSKISTVVKGTLDDFKKIAKKE